MKNEFGAQMDRAGYAPSILQPTGKSCCFLCGRPAGGEKMDRHEPWNGANRRKSMELGLWVNLHHYGCHEGPGSVHDQPAKARELRAEVQRAAMIRYGWSYGEWLERFGKSEISEEEADALTAPAAPQEAGDPSGAVRQLPFAKGALIGDAARRTSANVAGEVNDAAERRGGCDFGRAGALIRELWPDHQTTLAPSGFRLLPDPDLPF